jgi:hypothetical protein
VKIPHKLSSYDVPVSYSRTEVREINKVNLSLCLTNHALRHEGVWENECINQIFLISALAGSEWSASRPGCFTHAERAADTHCIGGWVDPRAGLDDVKKRRFLT